MRHLFTLALGGILGVCLMAGDAAACHKKSCGGGCAPVVCARPAPVVCPKPVKTCAPRVKKCGGLFHKKSACSTCSAPVVACNTGYAYGYSAPMASGQTYAAPQATGQMYGTPPVPAKR